MARKINAEGRQKIREWEARGGKPNLVAYQDGGGVWTIGFGHTGPEVRSGMAITAERAEQLLSADLSWAETAVATRVKTPLTDNQFSALVSFVFNVGENAFAKSTLLKKLNKGDYDAVPKELVKWNHDNGKVVAGLTNRRAAELGLWAKGAPVSSAYKDVEARPTKDGIKIAGGGIGIAGLGEAASNAADKLSGIAGGSATIGYVFTGLTLVGIAVAAYGAWHAFQQDRAVVA